MRVEHHGDVGPHIAGAEVLITFGQLLTDQVLRDAAKLRWIHGLGSGLDGLTDRPTLRPDVLVTNSRGTHSIAVAEAALALMFALARDVPRLSRNQAAGAWQRFAPSLLHGLTVTIIGVGAIAEALGACCQALGMRTVGVSDSRTQAPGFEQVVGRAQLRQAASEADFLIDLAPLRDDTKGLVNADVFAAMKPSAHFLNLGRGGTVDEGALIAALRERRIAGAALDVFAAEPLPADSPLWSLPNVIVSPHLGGLHSRWIDDVLPILEANMRAYLAGDRARMVNVVAGAA